MSNRGRTNDFDFDDDPFADNNNDAFDNFDDDDFGGDDLGDLDDLGGLDEFDGGGDDDFPPDDEDSNGENEGRSGPSRTFVLLGALLFITFLIGIGVIIWLGTRTPPVTGFDLTSTAVAIFNNTAIAQITETAVQRVQAEAQTQTATFELQFTQTADAGTAQAGNVFATQTADQVLLFGQQTETALAAVPTETPTVEITVTLDPIVETSQALTQESISQTNAAETAAILALTPTEPSGIGQIDATSVLLTATALASQLQPTSTGTIATPDSTRVFATPRPGTLPDTGLFDGVASGDGMGLVALMAFGLVGLIVISRRARASVNK